MEFTRNITTKLNAWSQSQARKPLILKGARQVGKTTLLKAFGKQRYGKVAYFNFERQPEIHELFKTTKDPHRLIKNLNLLVEDTIHPDDTLIFFDEIQECAEALTALKYFHEDASEYPVVAAGSLLGLASQGSFPVGKVAFMELHPLSYGEFLAAYDKTLHKAYLSFLTEPKLEALPMAFYNPLMDRFKEYMICGGMPEVVRTYITSKNIDEAIKIKSELLESYERDFAKHVDRNSDSQKIGYIWDSLPSQLARDNKKFIYGAAKKGARARDYENATEWLRKAGLVIKAHNVTVPRLPLKSYNDLSAFKLYLLDVGLLFGMSGLDPRTYVIGSTLFKEFKGALTENYVAQALNLQGFNANYWTSAGKAEVDFLLEYKGNLIPIEVKAGKSTKAKSLLVYQQKYLPELSVKIGAGNLSFDGKNLSIPLFYADKLALFIDKVIK